MPATAVQVFGPITVDPGFTTTGEKTLLTMNTSLPANGRNVILVAYVGFTSASARGTFRIYKGSTLLYETRIAGEHLTTSRTRPFHHLLMAVDNSPAGNDTYSFRINVTTAGTATGNVHVQGMVIKADRAYWAFNTSAVNIPAGGTGTVVSVSTTFPVGSKVVVIATVYAGAATTTAGEYLIGAENIRLNAGAIVGSTNQFNIGSYRDIYPLRVSLIYLDTPTTSPQTYSVGMTNGSAVAHNCWAEIVAFDVEDAAFLDTGSVAIGTTQTTVGNLATNLSGDVAVIALAAAERVATSDATTFNANTVVLQRDNSTTGQVGNLVAWYIFRTAYNARSGVLPLFRYDTGVTNPSYQVKMTAAAAGVANGEAKILAFLVSVPGLAIKRVLDETVRALEGQIFSRKRFGVVDETMRETEGATFGRKRFRVLTEQMRLSELGRVARNMVRPFLEVVNILESAIITGIGLDLVKVISEVERVTEAFRSLRNLLRRFAENVRITEASARLRSLFRRATENIPISEITARSRSIARIVGESVRSLEQAVRFRAISRLASEVSRISEAFVSAKRFSRSISEGLQLFEFRRILRSLARVRVEQVRMAEAISRTRRLFRVVIEGFPLNEVVMRSRRIAKLVGESVSVLESSFRTRLISLVVSEVVRVSELISSAMGRSLAIIESIQLSEADRRLRDLVRVASDAIRLSEFISKSARLVKILAEALQLLELGLAVRRMARSVSESVRVLEIVIRFKGVVKVVSEFLNLVELSRLVKGKVREISESIRVGESVEKLRIMVRAVLESAIIAESRLLARVVVKVMGEVVRIGELSLMRGIASAKTYIKRLASALRGMASGSLKGATRGGKF